MKPASSRIDEVRPEIEKIAEATGCELVHAELKGGTMRLFLDKPEGVSLADCEHVSKLVSAYLDVVDFGKGRYLLEVSSPGLDRQLYRPRDYERFLGRLARVALTEPETGVRRTVVGRLQELLPSETSEDDRVLVVVDEKSGERTETRLRDIRSARLEIEL
jgi:ribosome maturation factor RimP